MEMTLVYAKPAIPRLVGKNLAMAALGGSLLAASWWAETWALRGELKNVIPPYSLGCTRSDDKPATQLAGSPNDSCSTEQKH